jgi:hypothetical protein
MNPLHFFVLRNLAIEVSDIVRLILLICDEQKLDFLIIEFSAGSILYLKSWVFKIPKQNYFLNFGGKIVPECARLKNKFFHCIYVPYNGGCDSEEIKEIFKSII